MNAFGGDIATKSEGSWKLDNGMLLTIFGEGKNKCSLKKSSDGIIFSPDPLFKPEVIQTTEYRKIK